ncbi:MAG: succinate dehydrogenase cytochrome b subunit [Planctomycetaceae bacterium]|nr:succinate dehydrogenase cytochrome b subunit [Planctomycetaceae bacterium]
MSWFRLFVSSSLGKKYIMGITGLLLCGFLVTHLAGNLLMYVGDGRVYNDYAHTLHSQEGLIKVAEVWLLVIFALHLFLAFSLSRSNRSARGISYQVKKHKEGSESSPLQLDSWMLISGVAVFVFLLVHLSDFHFSTSMDLYSKEDLQSMEPFDKAVAVLTNPLRVGIYCAGTVFLAAHLAHGVASAFRSLGISHTKYNYCIRVLGYIFAVIFGLGFFTFPVWVYFKFHS